MQKWTMFADPKLFIVELVVIVLSITLHEFGHAISADMLGDDTPRRQGRVTLWPDKHFDPVGALMMFISLNIGRGIGWGRPVQVDTFRLKHPHRDMMLVTIAGPVMNLAIAITACLLLRIFLATGHVAWLVNIDSDGYVIKSTILGDFVSQAAVINIGLMFFNLIPIHPLDGGKILSGLLPLDQARRFDEFTGRYGAMLLFGIAFLYPQALGYIIGPAANHLFTLLAGKMGATIFGY